MKSSSSAGALRSIVLLWLGWMVLVLGFQAWATARVQLQPPDSALPWTAAETRGTPSPSPYLSGPFLNRQVGWDSEYYLSIATHGYDDPEMRAIPPTPAPDRPQVAHMREQPHWISVSYAFFPGYPMAIRAASLPFRMFGLAPVAAATLAGVTVSALGALVAMIALADLAGSDAEAGEDVRSAFYLLAWPAGFFLLQIYSEGLFLALSFGALALLNRRRWGWAALLAALAVWTRPTGALLAAPFVLTWLEDGGLDKLVRRQWRDAAPGLLAVAAPCAAYALWRLAMGDRFNFIETHYFGRGFMALRQSAEAIASAAAAVVHGNPQAAAYSAVELASTVIAFAACLLFWRRSRPIAVYGLLVLTLALTSGALQGMQRYVLSVPAIFLAAARLGRATVFDRLWTFGNVLVQAVFALTFSVDFWAG